MNIIPGELNIGNFRNTQGAYFQIIPFYNCSVNCSYCFTYSKLNSSLIITPTELKNILIKLDTETKDFKIVSLSILGGELTESKNYYKYLDIINEVFSYRKESVKIEFLSNINGSIKQYKYFYKIFSDYDEVWGYFTIHTKAVKNDNILEQYSKKLTEIKENNFNFDISFLQGTVEEYQKQISKIEKKFIEFNPYLKKYILHRPILNCSLFDIKGGTDFNKHNTKEKKVLCHANYFCILPEGLTNECDNSKLITWDDFFKNGLKKLKNVLICDLNECPCFPDLRNIVGYINLKK